MATTQPQSTTPATEAPAAKSRVFVTGGGGQLGSFLVHDLESIQGVDAAFSFRSDEKDGGFFTKSIPVERRVKIDLSKSENVDELATFLNSFRPDVIVNTAAIARPVFCEQNPDVAKSINVPNVLLNAMSKAGLKNTCFLIHISTDLVYDGTTSDIYSEQSPTNPPNVYGLTKLEAEKLIEKEWPHSICLRSSMIYGPVAPGQKSSFFTSFVDSVLSSKKPTDFFFDEFRNPIFIRDFSAVIVAILKKVKSNKSENNGDLSTLQLLRVYNFGGPDRLSRLEMAKSLCKYQGYDESLIISSSVKDSNRGVKSAMDTGMSSAAIEAHLEINLTSFSKGLEFSFPKT